MATNNTYNHVNSYPNTSFNAGSSAVSNLFGSAVNNFGAPNSIFNTPQPNKPLFGNQLISSSSNSTVFCGSAPHFGNNISQGTNVFSKSNASTSNMFSKNDNIGNFFGSSTLSSNSSNSLFNSNNKNTLVGCNSNSIFNYSPADNLFNSGSSNMNLGNVSGLFTSQPAGPGTPLPYQPTTSSDTVMKGSTQTNVAVKLECITAMKEYESKSLEELRLEDYITGRKLPQNSFGFSVQNSNNFTTLRTPQLKEVASNMTNLNFPNTTLATITSGNTFNKTGIQQFNSLFSNSLNSPGFNNENASRLGNMYNSSVPHLGSHSNNSNPQSTIQQRHIFGLQSQNSSGSHCIPNVSNHSDFYSRSLNNSFTSSAGGFSQDNDLFGKSNISLMGNNYNTSSVGFNLGQNLGLITNQKNPNFGSFGATSPGIGGSNSAFISTVSSSNAFLSKQNQNVHFVDSFKNPSRFDCQLNNSLEFKNLGLNVNCGVTTNTLFSSTPSSHYPSQPSVIPNAVEFQSLEQKLLLLSRSPFSESSLLQDAKDTRINTLSNSRINKSSMILFSPTSNLGIIPTVTHSKSVYKIRPYNSLINNVPLFQGLRDDVIVKSNLTNDDFDNILVLRKKSIKHLDIANTSQSTPVVQNSYICSPNNLQLSINHDKLLSSQNTVSKLTDSQFINGKNIHDEIQTEFFPVNEKETDNVDNINHQISIITNTDSTSTLSKNNEYLSKNKDEKFSQILKLTKPDYYTIPSIRNILSTAWKGEIIVNNFIIGRNNFGKIFFPGQTNLTGLNLDDIVFIKRKEVVVYPNDSEKPPIGHGLNKEAEITLEETWPIDKINLQVIKDPCTLAEIKYRDRVKKGTIKIGATFIDYEPITGTWTFSVKHFSKYKLVDEESDSDEDIIKSKIDHSYLHLENDLKNNIQSDNSLKKIPKDLKITNKLDDNPYGLHLNTDLSYSNHNASTKKMKFCVGDDFMINSLKIICDFEDSNQHCEPRSKSICILEDDSNDFFSNDSFSNRKNINKNNKLSLFSTLNLSKVIASNLKLIIEPNYDISSSFANINWSLTSSRQRDKIHISSSSNYLTYLEQRSMIDSGLYLAKSFRVGWGPNLSLSFLPNSSIYLNTVKILKIEIGKFNLNQITLLRDIFKNILSCINYKSLSVNDYDNSIPMLFRIDTIDIIYDLFEKYHSDFRNSLFLLLFCKFIIHSRMVDDNPYTCENVKRELFLDWLKEANMKIKKEINSDKCDYLDLILLEMSVGNLNAASNLALREGNYFLSLLLSKGVLVSIRKLKDYTYTQLELWDCIGASDYINPKLISILNLLAGVMPNIYQNDWSLYTSLTWVQKLGLYAFFVEYDALTLNKMLANFFNIMDIPLNSFLPTVTNSLYKKTVYNDSMLDLINMYIGGSISIERVSEVSGHTNCLFDYCISWIFIKFIKFLGVSTLYNSLDSFISMNFANQLLAFNLWDCAILVILLSSFSPQRYCIVQYIININCSPKDEFSAEENFLLEYVQLSPKHLYQGKSLLYLYDWDFWKFVYHLVHAECPDYAHNIAMDRIAYDAIITGNTLKLKNILKKIEFDGRLNKITHWEEEGSVLLDYSRIVETMQLLLKGNSCSATEFRKLLNGLKSLCTRFNNFPSQISGINMQLCQADMSKNIAQYLKLLTTIDKRSYTNHLGTTSYSQDTVPHLTKLPLLDDDKLFLTIDMCNQYANEIIIN